ncbi:Aspartyl protease family protein [Camellia lanceoleosa]|uniref:Aspartyl protease family protein n=1 Tax=Camellia lanceoleosa TaxID=1840588 RepID=A0ACC0FF10_9ERIC|nr:Aspartyl protease family protein [Camellia lanceoleosa]
MGRVIRAQRKGAGSVLRLPAPSLVGLDSLSPLIRFISPGSLGFINGSSITVLRVRQQRLVFLSENASQNRNKGYGKKATLKVVHKHGPCSHLSLDKANAPNVTQILSEDQSRVNIIHFRLSSNSAQNNIPNSSKATFPVNSGASIGTGNFIVTVGLGTPKKDLTLIFDTGSDLTWTQCHPCLDSCYRQQEPIFNPNESTTYKNISCNSAECTQLTSHAGGVIKRCSNSSTCIYGIGYVDQSYSVGFFSKDTLTLTPTDELPNFRFGCGQSNHGLFGGAAGLLGLARNQLSVVSQTSSMYQKYFSYCLPSTSSSTGHLTFGKGGTSSALKLNFTHFPETQTIHRSTSSI